MIVVSSDVNLNNNIKIKSIFSVSQIIFSMIIDSVRVKLYEERQTEK